MKLQVCSFSIAINWNFFFNRKRNIINNEKGALQIQWIRYPAEITLVKK